MTETAVDRIPSPLYGTAVLLVWGAIDPRAVDETALNDWWTNEHLPERLALPGFARARRYFSRTLAGESKYLALYEAEHSSDFRSEEYLEALGKPTARTEQFMPCLAQLNRSACEVVYFQSNTNNGKSSRGLVGNCVALITFLQPVEGDSDKVEPGAWESIRTAVDTVLARPGTLSVHILSEDEEITRIGSTSKSYESVQFHAHDRGTNPGKRIALIEFSLPLGSGAVETRNALGNFRIELEERGGVLFTIETFDLICAMELHP